MMNAIKQIIYDFRSQSIISTVTLLGTALAVFLIMVVVMMQRIEEAPFEPETNRDNMLYGKFLHLESVNGHGSSSGGASYEVSKELYENLPGVAGVAYVLDDVDRVEAGVKGEKPFIVDKLSTDVNFWKLYDFTFINGRPFNEGEFDASMRVVVITENAARKLFGTTDVVGREMDISRQPYTIVGVIKSVSSLANHTYSEIYIPLTTDGATEPTVAQYGVFAMVSGPITTSILLEHDADITAIKDEVRRRMELIDNRFSEDSIHVVNHNQPYTIEESNSTLFSNSTPDVSNAQRQKLILFAILLIIPAINLSSMTHSRLRRRINEIGVRRAFGCTRATIMKEILAENFIVTFAGGIIGLLLSMIFICFFAGILFSNWGGTPTAENLAIPLTVLLNVPTIIWTLFFCLLLNLLSAGIPAWQASRVNPVEAINRK